MYQNFFVYSPWRCRHREQTHGHRVEGGVGLSHFVYVRLCVTLWAIAHQAPLSMGFSGQEHEWVAVSFSRGSSNPEIEPASLMSPALTGSFFATSAIWESGMETYTLPCIKYSQWEFAVWHRELKPVFSDHLEQWDGVGVGREFQEGETYVWLIRVAVWQKPAQYCKTNILQ